MLRQLTLVCLLHAAAAFAADKSNSEKLPDFPLPACLGGELLQKDNALFFAQKRLPFDTVPRDLASAAYYEKSGLLVTVSSAAQVALYETKDGKLVEKAKHESPDSSVRIVMFTRVPGLLYLYCTDLKRAEMLKKNRFMQMTSESASRIALTDEAQKYEALPGKPSPGEALSACFRLNAGKSVPFSLKPGEWHTLELSEPLGDPFCGGPEDTMAANVFAFEKQIVCRTKNGWSVHELDGRLVKHFADPKIDKNLIWWMRPTQTEKGITITARDGPGGKTYRLDIQSGQLVEEQE